MDTVKCRSQTVCRIPGEGEEKKERMEVEGGYGGGVGGKKENEDVVRREC